MTGDTLSLHDQWVIAVIGLAVVAVVLAVAARLISRQPREDRIWAEPEDIDGADTREWARGLGGPETDDEFMERLLAGLAAGCERDIPDGLDAPAPLNVSGPEPAAPRRHPPPPRRPGRRPPLPPVDEAEHLQPIAWDDAAGSFAAFCEVPDA